MSAIRTSARPRAAMADALAGLAAWLKEQSTPRRPHDPREIARVLAELEMKKTETLILSRLKAM